MVEYEYEELFETHEESNMIIVQSGATLTWNSNTHRFDISNSEYVIRDTDLKVESFTLDESLCSDSDLKFGKCEASHIKFTLLNRTNVPNLKDEVLDIYFYFDDTPETLFQVGQYTVTEDKYLAGRTQRDITGYDWNYFLRDLDITAWYNKYFDTNSSSTVYRETLWVIVDLFKWIQGVAPYNGSDKVSKASPELPVELDSNFTLTNGAFVLSKTIESDTVTFGMFMEGILEFNGTFGHINRQGKFQIILMEWYDKDPVRIVTDNTRIPPTSYDDIATWGIGQIDVYDRTNARKFRVRNTAKKYPSTYVMVDPWILADKESGDSVVQTALERMQMAIYHLNYRPSDTECTGDLCVEVGDRINVTFEPAEGDTRDWFRSYVLERHFTGINGFKDRYSAKGHKKQPKYKVTNDRWHTGDSASGTDGSGTGEVAEVNDEHDRRVIAILRNYGEPMLDEPVVELVYNKQSQQVEIKWTDPADIDSWSPSPIEWAGTEVVRKEGSAPIHGWGTVDSEHGGTVLVTSTTRDEYSETAYVDDTIEPNKRYYYAIRPYFIKLADTDHPVKQFRWTKIYSVDTVRFIEAPVISIGEASGTTIRVAYIIPHLETGEYTSCKLVGKKGSIPTSKTDGDYIYDVEEVTTLPYIGVQDFEGLDERSTYYFVLFIEDDMGAKADSEAVYATTGRDEGWSFDYTGEIQTFVAPKTGIYQLETWGAQGGNATDGTLTARGGYGAYAVGEVFLTQGDTFYINVGGQNGYGGGGNYVAPNP